MTATPQNAKRPQQLAQPDSFLLPVWLGRFIFTQEAERWVRK